MRRQGSHYAWGFKSQGRHALEVHAPLCWKPLVEALWCCLRRSPISALRSVPAARRKIDYVDKVVNQAWCSGKE